MTKIIHQLILIFGSSAIRSGALTSSAGRVSSTPQLRSSSTQTDFQNMDDKKLLLFAQHFSNKEFTWAQESVPEQRELQDIHVVLWNFRLRSNREENWDNAVCTSDETPLISYLTQSAEDLAREFLVNYIKRRNLSSSLVKWHLDDSSVVVDPGGERRELISKTSFVFTAAGDCIFCNADNRDMRRLASSSSKTGTTLSDFVAKYLKRMTKKDCGIPSLSEVVMEQVG